MGGVRTEPEPKLTIARPPGAARAVVLVLHGGRARSQSGVGPLSAAALRMEPFAHALKADGADLGLAVAKLRFGVRGWNGSLQSPVHDARWAMTRLRHSFGDVPIGLVGHSMGGRTALVTADADGVHSVVALAPWVEPYDPVTAISGRRLIVLHGDHDGTTDPRAARRYVEQAALLARSACFVSVRNEGHGMLRRPALWHRIASSFTLAALELTPLGGTESRSAANIVRSALSGETSLVV